MDPQRVLVLSDIHLGDPRSGPADRDIIDTILAIPYDLVILNGDFIDLWASQDMDHLVYVHTELVSLLRSLAEKKKLLWIVGNHEYWPRPLAISRYLLNRVIPDIKIIDSYVLNYGDQLYLVTHGHQMEKADIAMRPGLLFWFNLLVWRLTHIDLQKFLRNFLGIYERSISKRQAEFVDHFSGYYNQVILGHTHKPCIGRVNTVRFTNCGDWIEHRSYATIINGVIELHEVKS